MALDPRSDIFSFGAILYEMLSGKRAFHGDTPADTMSSILKEDPPELTETNRNVSPALERIVQHCLEKNPESRFHSASDIAFDLEHLSGLSGSRGEGGGSGEWQRENSPAAPQASDRRSRPVSCSQPRCMVSAGGRGEARRPRASGRVSADHVSHRLHRQCPLYARRQHCLQRRVGGRRRTALHVAHWTIPARANWESRMPNCFRFRRAEKWPSGSTPSVTAAMLAAARWRGFR